MQCKVEFTARVDRAVDPEGSRYALSGVQVTPDADGRVFCAATNSRILTITRQAGKTDETCILPGSLVAGKAGERNAVVEFDDTAKHWKRTALVKGSQVSRIESIVEGRFPRVGEVLPDFGSEPTMSVSFDPWQLLQAAEAMGCDGEQRAITLLVQIPRSENLLPPPNSVVAAIEAILGDEDTDRTYTAQKLWALGINEDGSWDVGRFTDENRMAADWGLGKWFVVVTYRSMDGMFEPTCCADVLLTQARMKFSNVKLNAFEPIALLNEKRNIGVIMPWAGENKVDRLPEYLATRQAYLAALAGKTVIEAVEVDGEPAEPPCEPVSLRDLEAQLTALLAQCS